jgi:hypothetical protein
MPDNEVKQANFKEQIAAWQQRVDELHEWTAKNDYNHPKWEQKSRDLRNALIKIEQLKNRRDGYNNHVGSEYSVPKFNK